MKERINSESYLKNALTLAYLGDAVFSLLVREKLVIDSNVKPNTMNKRANEIVCARNQAEIMRKIETNLTDDELDISLRARNSHLQNRKAKHSTIEEYSLATQFEALIGYWYLNKNFEKLKNIMNEYVWSEK